MKRLFIIVVMVFLGGCFSKAITADNAVRVPADRVFYTVGNSNGDSIITVTRDSGMFGSACYLAIFINGSLAARIGRGETVSFAVSPGDYLVGIANDPDGKALCGLPIPLRELGVQLKADEQKKFRLYVDINTGASITQSSF